MLNDFRNAVFKKTSKLHKSTFSLRLGVSSKRNNWVFGQKVKVWIGLTCKPNFCDRQKAAEKSSLDCRSDTTMGKIKEIKEAQEDEGWRRAQWFPLLSPEGVKIQALKIVQLVRDQGCKAKSRKLKTLTENDRGSCGLASRPAGTFLRRSAAVPTQQQQQQTDLEERRDSSHPVANSHGCLCLMANSSSSPFRVFLSAQAFFFCVFVFC